MHSFRYLFLLDIINDFLLNDTRHVLSLVLYSITVLHCLLHRDHLCTLYSIIFCNSPLNRYLLDSLHLIVFNTTLLIRNVVHTRLGCVMKRVTWDLLNHSFFID